MGPYKLKITHAIRIFLKYNTVLCSIKNCFYDFFFLASLYAIIYNLMYNAPITKIKNIFTEINNI